MSKLSILTNFNFGQSVAEQEIEQLHKYFVQTKQWKDLLSGTVDIVYGPKGAGKSALYTLLNNNEASLFQRGVALYFAESPRGATVFSDLQVSPPASELEFTNLWKLYFLILLGGHFVKYGTQTSSGAIVVSALQSSGLLPKEESPIKKILATVRAYIKKYFNPESFEPTIAFDEHSGLANGLSLKVTFKEPTQEQDTLGIRSVADLIEKANEELLKSGFTIWFLLDRLDVAFADTPELEANALRALFKVYLEMVPLDNIKLKIFLRSDIWGRITKTGFREATHITKATTITWEHKTLLNLIIRRFLNNGDFVSAYKVDRALVLSSMGEQETLFKRIFPEKVDLGNNPLTLAWIIGRTSDAKENYSPRDIINLVNFCVSRQVKLLEAGEAEPPEENLFQRSVIKDALTDASKEKVEKHLFAEYPGYRPLFETLRSGKSQYSLIALAQLWKTSDSEALTKAQDLVDIGFWLKKSDQYWIPFIYRDGLDITQGQAEL